MFTIFQLYPCNFQWDARAQNAHVPHYFCHQKHVRLQFLGKVHQSNAPRFSSHWTSSMPNHTSRLCSIPCRKILTAVGEDTPTPQADERHTKRVCTSSVVELWNCQMYLKWIYCLLTQNVHFQLGEGEGGRSRLEVCTGSCSQIL